MLLKLAVNNKVMEMHLCGRCAPHAAGGSFGGFDIGPMNMAGNVSGYFKEFLPREKRALHCRDCGQPYHKFKETGLLGCPGCYGSFGPQLAELLTRIHGTCQHTGKCCRPSAAEPSPYRGASAQSLAGLRQALKKAVESEDFETAAGLRDRIRRLGGANG